MKTSFQLFGYEVGKGWKPIVMKAVEQIEAIHEENLKNTPEWFNSKYERVSFEAFYGKSNVSQVKEKYGTLRIYAGYHTDEIDKIIRQAEKECDNTCELCGSKEDVKLRGERWYSTMCKECWNRGEGKAPYGFLDSAKTPEEFFDKTQDMSDFTPKDTENFFNKVRGITHQDKVDQWTGKCIECKNHILDTGHKMDCSLNPKNQLIDEEKRRLNDE